MTNETTTITFKLPFSLREKIKAEAVKEDRSEASMIRRLLSEALDVTNEEVDEEPETQTSDSAE